MKCSLGIFLKRSLVFSILLFSSIFLSLLAILWSSAFICLYLSFSPLLVASLLFTANCKSSPDSHLGFCKLPDGRGWLGGGLGEKLGLAWRVGLCSAAAANLLRSCLTLCNPIDGSPPGSPVPGILQARTLEWVAISFSNA